MAELGVNVDKIGTVNAESLHWLGSRVNRIVAAPPHVMEQLSYVRSMKNAGQNVLLCFDHDAYRAFGAIDDPQTWRQAANWGRAVFAGLIDAVEPVNEPDGSGFESSVASIPIVNGMLEAHAKAWGTSMLIVGCATVSGQVSYYQQTRQPKVRLDLIDRLSFHPYAKWSPEELTAIIDQHAALGRMLWITEVGLNAPNDDEQATFLQWTLETINRHPAVEVCTWFCAHPYENWGMVRPEDGTWRPSAEAFREIAMRAAPADPYQFVLGFKDVADKHPDLIGKALENEYGFMPFMQIQRTENGMLFWAHVLNNEQGIGFKDFTSGDLYKWNGEKLEKV